MNEKSQLEAKNSTPNEDDWHTVTDAKKRKQIQDRLAQRARRRRLREAKQNLDGTPQCTAKQESAGSLVEHHCFCFTSQEGIPELGSLDDFNLLPLNEKLAAPLPSQSLALSVPYPEQAPCISYDVPQHGMPVLSALFINGQLLNLTCGSILWRRSPAVSPSVPLSLQPTQSQLLIEHNTGFDRFPFPKMRDNCITFGPILDVEDFMSDIFTTTCFSIAPGGSAWDPKAWRMEKNFAAKWGFLFY